MTTLYRYSRPKPKPSKPKAALLFAPILLLAIVLPGCSGFGTRIVQQRDLVYQRYDSLVDQVKETGGPVIGGTGALAFDIVGFVGKFVLDVVAIGIGQTGDALSAPFEAVGLVEEEPLRIEGMMIEPDEGTQAAIRDLPPTPPGGP